MATPRSQLVDPEVPLHYHLISRCVRRSYLCGRDARTGKDYNHRKQWLTQRMFKLARCFAVEIDGYAIMDNHFHLVVYYDPQACHHWSNEEVATRWIQAFPPRSSSSSPEEQTATATLHHDALLQQPERLQQYRRTLGSLSAFMKHLKQPIAWRANREDGCSGHFFEDRFYSGALLCEDSVLATMAYVDLNPFRAKIAASIEQCQDTSIANRLQVAASDPKRLAQALAPLVSGLTDSDRVLPMSLSDYCEHLSSLIDYQPDDVPGRELTWFNRVASIRKRQRAYGFEQAQKNWALRRGWRRSCPAMGS